MALEQLAKEVCNIIEKLCNSAYYLFLSLVTSKELKIINLFGPLVERFFFGTGSSLNVATSRPQSSMIFNPSTDLVSVKLQPALGAGKGRTWLQYIL